MSKALHGRHCLGSGSGDYQAKCPASPPGPEDQKKEQQFSERLPIYFSSLHCQLGTDCMEREEGREDGRGLNYTAQTPRGAT